MEKRYFSEIFKKELDDYKKRYINMGKLFRKNINSIDDIIFNIDLFGNFIVTLDVNTADPLFEASCGLSVVFDAFRNSKTKEEKEDILLLLNKFLQKKLKGDNK